MTSNIKFDEYDLDNGTSVALDTRFILDGASTLDEAIAFAMAYVGYLEDLLEDGYELTDVVNRGKGVVSLDVEKADDSIF